MVVKERKKSRIITHLLAAEAPGRMEMPLSEMKLTTSREVFVGGGRFRNSPFDMLNCQTEMLNRQWNMQVWSRRERSGMEVEIWD